MCCGRHPTGACARRAGKPCCAWRVCCSALLTPWPASSLTRACPHATRTSLPPPSLCRRLPSPLASPPLPAGGHGVLPLQGHVAAHEHARRLTAVGDGGAAGLLLGASRLGGGRQAMRALPGPGRGAMKGSSDATAVCRRGAGRGVRRCGLCRGCTGRGSPIRQFSQGSSMVCTGCSEAIRNDLTWTWPALTMTRYCRRSQRTLLVPGSCTRRARMHARKQQGCLTTTPCQVHHTIYPVPSVIGRQKHDGSSPLTAAAHSHES